MNWSSFSPIPTGANVAAAVVNAPLNALAQRTEYLYSRFGDIEAQDDGSFWLQGLVLRDVNIDPAPLPGHEIGVGTAVYFDPSSSCWKAALADATRDDIGVGLYDKSFCCGVVVSTSGAIGNVLFSGKYALPGSALKLQDNETFRQGPYWVSARQPGCVTQTKPDVAIYVGSFYTNFAVVNVQHRDMAEAHTHLAFALHNEVAGALTTRWNHAETDPAVSHLTGYFPTGQTDVDFTLAVGGAFTGTPATYAITYRLVDGAPTLTWTSTDSEEVCEPVTLGADLASALNVGHALGTKGVKVWLTPVGDYTVPATNIGDVVIPKTLIQDYTVNDPDLGTNDVVLPDAATVAMFTVAVAGFAYPGDLHLTAVEAAAYTSSAVLTVPDADVAALVVSVSVTEPTMTGLADGAAWSLEFPDAGQGWCVRDPDFANIEAALAPYEYNIGFHTELNSVYPPVPLRASALMLNGVELTSELLYPDSGYSVYSLSHRTIYWQSTAPEIVPWPIGEELYQDKQLTFQLTKASAGNSGFVTSLSSATNSPIKLYAAGTTIPATCGDLDIALDLVLATDNGTKPGYLVVKESMNNTLKRGAVVEKVMAGSDDIVVSQLSGHPEGQGIVSISTRNATIAGAFDVVALENAKEDRVGMFPYIKLMGRTSGIASAFTATFQVPYNLPASAQYKAIIYATVFGNRPIPSGLLKYAGVNFSYSILPDYYSTPPPVSPDTTPAVIAQSNLLTASANLITNLVNVELGSSTGTYTAYDPILIHNDPVLATNMELLQSNVLGSPFPESPYLRPGYTVAVRFAGAASTYTASEYTGDLGFLNLRWKLERV